MTIRADFYLLTSPLATARTLTACKIIEKASLSGLRVFIQLTDSASVDEFDLALWSFRDTSFVAHTQDPLDTTSTVFISSKPIEPTGFDLLVNLTEHTAAANSTSLTRIVEIIPGQQSAKEAARIRFREYRELGFEMHTHNL